jgi:charged multivesicular body protein 3
MQSINRFLYGPTPEEKVRAWQIKLRTETRHLDREMRQVRFSYLSLNVETNEYTVPARCSDETSTPSGEAACGAGRRQVGTNTCTGGGAERQAEGPLVCQQGTIGLYWNPAYATDGWVAQHRAGTTLNCAAAMIKVTGSLQKSTEIMKLSNALIKLPQISQTMREMSMEMTKVGRWRTP